MAQIDERLTTGLVGMDRLLKGLIRGDNIVWQISDVEHYRLFVEPYCRAAARVGEPLVYFRFPGEPNLLPEGVSARQVALDPRDGFETFVTGIHRTIEATGRGGYYVFDCLSGLAEAWRSDQMLGNFFMLTCPYLFDIEAIAYFGLRRNVHSFHATRAITETTQIFLDVFGHRSHVYVHPWKVQSRHSSTMHMLHVWHGEAFEPVTESATIAEVRHTMPWLQSQSNQAGLWNRTFARAAELGLARTQGDGLDEEQGRCFDRLLRMCVSRDERILRLLERFFTLEDVVEIGKRMIGTGRIGGKSVGMLLARAILAQADPDWAERLEPHDSFFVGSDVFYTYLVRNGIWALRGKAQDPDRYLEGAERARQRMLIGTFPEDIEQQFEDMLDYYGQSPIIVRSSSLLEDNFGNAFAGKYDSVFCANQGSRHQRLQDFLAAVRQIYASTMSERALTYRAQRGLLHRDEQMALLVQRVSGKMIGERFFPDVAGVGFSFNPFVWDGRIDPDAGVLRLVFGMGTRAVDRSDDDYTRLVALNAPLHRPEENSEQIRRYSQRKVDVLDLTSNQLVSARFADIARQADQLPMDLLASEDPALSGRPAESLPEGTCRYVLTFQNLLNATDFIPALRDMLQTLQQAYDHPVDVEFTANVLPDGLKINLVQCRPLQVQTNSAAAKPPENLDDGQALLSAREAVIGRGTNLRIDRLVYVVPEAYAELPLAERHSLARLVGKVCNLPPATAGSDPAILLLGPGRWGTTTPSLGVPVRFSEIHRACALCEIVVMNDVLTPEVSLGTHFFSDLIESDILYFAMFPQKTGNAIDHDRLAEAPNRLTDLLAGDERAEAYAHILRVLQGPDLLPDHELMLYACPLKQQAAVYLQPNRNRPVTDGSC